MNERIRNPHTFDMSNYFSGITCVVGGRDFEREEKETPSDKKTTRPERKLELDWSFLRKTSNRTPKR